MLRYYLFIVELLVSLINFVTGCNRLIQIATSVFRHLPPAQPLHHFLPTTGATHRFGRRTATTHQSIVRRSSALLTFVMKASGRMQHDLAANEAAHLMASLEVVARIYASRGEIHTVPAVLWTALACLRCTHPQYFAVYRAALRLVRYLVYETSLLLLCLSTPMGSPDAVQPRVLLEYGNEWSPAFEGVIPLLSEGMCHDATLHTALSVMRVALRSDSGALEGDTYVGPAGSRLLTATVLVLPGLSRIAQPAAKPDRTQCHCCCGAFSFARFVFMFIRFSLTIVILLLTFLWFCNCHRRLS